MVTNPTITEERLEDNATLVRMMECNFANPEWPTIRALLNELYQRRASRASQPAQTGEIAGIPVTLEDVKRRDAEWLIETAEFGALKVTGLAELTTPREWAVLDRRWLLRYISQHSAECESRPAHIGESVT